MFSVSWKEELTMVSHGLGESPPGPLVDWKKSPPWSLMGWEENLPGPTAKKQGVHHLS